MDSSNLWASSPCPNYALCAVFLHFTLTLEYLEFILKISFIFVIFISFVRVIHVTCKQNIHLHSSYIWERCSNVPSLCIINTFIAPCHHRPTVNWDFWQISAPCLNLISSFDQWRNYELGSPLTQKLGGVPWPLSIPQDCCRPTLIRPEAVLRQTQFTLSEKFVTIDGHI